MNATNSIQVLNNTDPDNALLTCVDGFEPEEVILVQCINGTWHPDLATLNCTEKSPPTEDSGKIHLFMASPAETTTEASQRHFKW